MSSVSQSTCGLHFPQSRLYCLTVLGALPFISGSVTSLHIVVLYVIESVVFFPCEFAYGTDYNADVQG